MKKIALMSVALLGLGLAGCEDSTGMGSKQTIGTLGGGVAGGLLGAQLGHGTGRLWTTGAGVLLGGLAGSAIGHQLDQADRDRVAYAQQQAYTAPIGQPITWNNPQNGNNGSVVVTRDGQTANGGYCREFQQTIVVGGQRQSAYGTACRQPDGSWQIVNNP